MKRWIALLVAVLMLVPLAAGAEIVFVDRTAEEAAQQEGAAAEGETLFTFTDGTGASTTTQSTAEEGWPRRIVVSVGGDCTLGSTDNQRASDAGFDSVIADKGYGWPFSELLNVFGQDDLTLVNFEGTLTESNDKQEKLFNFKGPADYAQMLVLGSVEAVTLANNHFGDYGKQGQEDTKAALSQYGITYCASGLTATYEVRGVKIGLIGNTFSYKDGKCDITKDVKALREEGCDIVIASFHWGSEYSPDFTRDQRNIGRAAIKSGADVVVGHHPHVIQGIEKYEDTYILYSLGNLVFGGNVDPDPRDTYIAQLMFDVYEDGTVEGPQVKIIPMRLTELAKGTDYRPVFAQGEEHDRIYKRILSLSRNMDGFVNAE